MGYLPASVKNAMIAAGFVPSSTTYYYGFAGPTSPGDTGANEVTGTATHKRQGSHVSTPTTGVEHNTAAMTWTNTGAWTVKFFVINVAATGSGTYKGGGPTTSTLVIPEGATIAASIGAFALSQEG